MQVSFIEIFHSGVVHEEQGALASRQPLPSHLNQSRSGTISIKTKRENIIEKKTARCTQKAIMSGVEQ